MVDTKKASVKSAAKASAPPQGTRSSEKPKVKASGKAPRAEKVPVVPAPAVASREKVSLPEKVAPLAAVSEAANVEPIAPPLNLVAAAAVEAVASSAAPKAAVFRQAVGEAVTASANGALAVNDKVIEALQTQSHAALDLWRSAVSTPHLSDVYPSPEQWRPPGLRDRVRPVEGHRRDDGSLVHEDRRAVEFGNFRPQTLARPAAARSH